MAFLSGSTSSNIIRTTVKEFQRSPKELLSMIITDFRINKNRRLASDFCNSKGSYSSQQMGNTTLSRALFCSSQQISASAKGQLPTERPRFQCHPAPPGYRSNRAGAGAGGPKGLRGLLCLFHSPKEDLGCDSYCRPQMAEQENNKKIQNGNPKVHSVISDEGECTIFPS